MSRGCSACSPDDGPGLGDHHILTEVLVWEKRCSCLLFDTGKGRGRIQQTPLRSEPATGAHTLANNYILTRKYTKLSRKSLSKEPCSGASISLKQIK
eukprot:3244379-Rhodomonas_salina.1